MKTYIGLTATDFKSRYGVHTKAFSDPSYCQTTLSKHILELKDQGIEPTVTWKIVDKAKSYSPVSDVCQLCNKEAYHIIFESDMAELNNRKLLFPKKRGRPRKSPRT